MVLKVHGFASSTCTKRVLTTLTEKSVPWEFIEIDPAKGEHKAPAFVAIQPFGQVPYIVDEDGFTLYESRAICRYIAAKYAHQGTKLIPAPDDFAALGKFEQAASIEFSNFDPFAYGIAAERVFKPMRGIATNEQLVESHLATLKVKLDAYDVILAKQKYLAGDEVTLADLFHLPYGAFLKVAGVDIMEDTSRPNLLRWWNDITSRASWKAVNGSA